MSNKKVYICSECGYIFPSELSELIEEGTQVYCERCGKPFSLEGKKFTQRQFRPSERRVYPGNYKTPEKKPKTYSSLNNAIQNINKFSYIFILIASIGALAMIIEILWNPNYWIMIIIRQSLTGLAGIIIAVIDKKFISEKIKNGNYGDILLDSFCLGILGCIIYGSGVFLLLKGILLIMFVFLNSKNTKTNAYEIGLMLKNSLNNFSSKAGAIIIIFAFTGLFGGEVELGGSPLISYLIYFSTSNIIQILPQLIAYSVLLVLAIISLVIDYNLKDKIEYKQSFKVNDGVRTFILGVLGVMFFSAGIFILLKGILLVVLYLAKPHGYKKKKVIVKCEKVEKEREKEDLPQKKEKELIKTNQKIELIEKPEGKEIREEKKEKIKEEITKIKKEEQEELEREEAKTIKEKEMETNLHESLLPVKNEKDKKLVKEYFSKIFAVLSKDIREKIKNLKIPKKEKKELLKELAFLTKEQQIKYIDALIRLYQQKIPQKLIEKIRKLPNVKPENYDKIIEQLKYMDSKEQIQFIQFLEKYA